MPEETETKKSLWRRYLEVSLIWKMAVALVVGVVAGLIFGEDIVTRSSAGTLPVSIQAAERLGVRKGVYSFTLPLGANMNMDGTRNARRRGFRLRFTATGAASGGQLMP